MLRFLHERGKRSVATIAVIADNRLAGDNNRKRFLAYYLRW